MKEYEYSFEVKSLSPYIKYCEENGYFLKDKNKQSRTIYRNSNKTMARITINESNEKVTKQLDFKDDILSNDVLIERKESMALDFADDEAVNSILEFLNYRKDNTLIRTRIVYEKNGIKFELDDYQEPRKAFVVAIEGEKSKVDKEYELVKSLNE